MKPKISTPKSNPAKLTPSETHLPFDVPRLQNESNVIKIKSLNSQRRVTRYGEEAEEVVWLNEWKCPKCRDICNCSCCMKKKGQKPTRILVHTAKATGFSSVSDGKIFKKPRHPYEECLDAELKLVGEYGLRCSMASSSDEVPVWERRAFCNILPVWDRSSVRVKDTYAS
ncbi:hypothetical protein IFM89_006992 [Coptis chinensis]|uniref:Zinc-finger domain-containing protein n=1 Tax=Coptis chinensis TaxID=261450 RepID=A0A835M7M5_9MAGN|nr:hypothetical protein IFM89_006992 [Coptis chinensis]